MERSVADFSIARDLSVAREKLPNASIGESMSRPPLSAAEFEAIVKLSGLRLTPTQSEEFLRVHAIVQTMCERVRTPGSGYDAEPAHVFKPIER